MQATEAACEEAEVPTHGLPLRLWRISSRDAARHCPANVETKLDTEALVPARLSSLCSVQSTPAATDEQEAPTHGLALRQWRRSCRDAPSGATSKVDTLPSQSIVALGSDDPPRKRPRTTPRLRVKDADTDDIKKNALALHCSKAVYAHREKQHLRALLSQGRQDTDPSFRTYVLVDAGDSRQPVVSAITLRVNEYAAAGRRRWVQILNMSSREERCGYGAKLYHEVERILRTRDHVNVLVLYPVNEFAVAFWAACGFELREDSLLPKEDLVPDYEHGKLLVGVNIRNGTNLPRWERRVGATPPPKQTEE